MASATKSTDLLTLFYRLTKPPFPTESVEDRLRMRMISSLFLFQAIVSVLVALAYLPLQSDSIALPATLGFGLLSLLCYGISRTRFIMTGVFFYIVLMIVMLFALFISNHDNPNALPEYSLSYVVAVIFFSSLLFSIRTTILIAGINLAGIAALPLVVDDLLYPVHFLWLFVFVTSVLIVVTVMIRRDIMGRLQESENRSRNLIAAYIDAVAIQSKRDGIMAINPSFTELLGYKPENVLNKSFTDFACDDDSANAIKQWLSLDAKSEPFEVSLRHQNDESIVVEIICQPHEYDGDPAHVIVARDMRKYKDAIRRTHEQEMRYQSLLDLTEDAVFISNFDGEYIAVNHHAAAIFGVSRDELVGKSYRDFVPQVYHTASKRVIDRLLNNEPVPMYERTFIRANGHRFPAEVMVHLLRDVDGNPQFVHSVVRDISERKRAEDQRIELAIERERMSTLQQFLRDAAHYFRTPLTSLKTSQYLLTQIKDNPVKQAHFLNIIKLEVARLERLISDMMMSTQLERDSGDGITFGRLDLAEVLPETISVFSPSEKREQYAEIVLEPIEPKTMYIMASRAKFTIAINRLLENAVRYSPDDSTVTVRAYQQEQNICIEIKDEGIGITEDEMPLLFQRFRRADRAIDKEHVGNGLGLFITQKIVEMHYGEIKVESEPDKWTRFTVCLPMALRPRQKLPTEPTRQISPDESSS